jgi:Family of unknown function (DUF6384)
MSETAESPAAAEAPRPKLDELMLSMDVVDTLRHQESLVARELDEDTREAELIERLRTLYRNQGLEVPDRILEEGVKALKESRFVYTPPPQSLATRLARLWVARGRLGGLAALALGIVVAAWLIHGALVTWPRERAQKEARIEISETLPKALDAARAAVKAESRDPAADREADQFLADGRAALSRGDPAGARQAISSLQALEAKLRQTYQLLIVSRPGEPSGAFRIPARNPSARNYYLIVEAIGPDGKPIPMAITSQEVAEAVRRDKSDDGILQNRKLGEKLRGHLDVTYAMPVQKGAITEW